jgi:hypothetical protein
VDIYTFEEGDTQPVLWFHYIDPKTAVKDEHYATVPEVQKWVVRGAFRPTLTLCPSSSWPSFLIKMLRHPASGHCLCNGRCHRRRPLPVTAACNGRFR